MDIKRSYRTKAKETHPDKQPYVNKHVAADQFREVVQAYEILSNPNSRLLYDEELRDASNLRGANGYVFKHSQHFHNYHPNGTGLERLKTNYRTGLDLNFVILYYNYLFITSHFLK
jgi:curved DNA-binding protein CbpA